MTLSFFKRLRSSFVVLTVLATIGVGCSPSVTPAPASSQKLTLKYWSVVNDFDAFDDIVKSYRAIHPNVTVEYRKFRLEEYEEELIDALAEDRGPDIVSIHNTWTKAYQPKLLPAPSMLRLAYRELQGTLKKQPVWVEKVVPMMSAGQMRNVFVDQIGEDSIMLGSVEGQKQLVEQIYGLPLALDSLALYYNRDVLNAAGVPVPAQNWNEFQDHVKRVTRYDEQGKLRRPAAGIGTAYNVDRYFDILSLLMMQNGTEMTDENGFPKFNKIPRTMTDREVAPGTEALVFYTDFANPTKEVFTWDDTQPNSFDAFISGKTAYFFGYSYHLNRIKAQAPKLNFGVTSIPQIDPAAKTNYANYWLEAVSKKTEHPDEAWDFIQFMTREANVKSYLEKTGQPTALRSLINTQLGDAELAPFASQTLTAKSWYRGRNVQATETAFADMIKSVLAGSDPRKVIGLAVDVVGQTLR